LDRPVQIGVPLEIPLSIAPEQSGGWVDVLFAFPYTKQPSDADTRRLAVSISELRLQWQGDEDAK
jgi:hypothetical protein